MDSICYEIGFLTFLFAAMDGVNYIADHTRKEEESTKVNIQNVTHTLSSQSDKRVVAIHLCLNLLFFHFRLKMACCNDVLKWHLIPPWSYLHIYMHMSMKWPNIQTKLELIYS